MFQIVVTVSDIPGTSAVKSDLSESTYTAKS